QSELAVTIGGQRNDDSCKRPVGGFRIGEFRPGDLSHAGTARSAGRREYARCGSPGVRETAEDLQALAAVADAGSAFGSGPERIYAGFIADPSICGSRDAQ